MKSLRFFVSSLLANIKKKYETYIVLLQIVLSLRV